MKKKALKKQNASLRRQHTTLLARNKTLLAEAVLLQQVVENSAQTINTIMRDHPLDARARERLTDVRVDLETASTKDLDPVYSVTLYDATEKPLVQWNVPRATGLNFLLPPYHDPMEVVAITVHPS